MSEWRALVFVLLHKPNDAVLHYIQVANDSWMPICFYIYTYIFTSIAWGVQKKLNLSISILWVAEGVCVEWRAKSGNVILYDFNRKDLCHFQWKYSLLFLVSSLFALHSHDLIEWYNDDDCPRIFEITLNINDFPNIHNNTHKLFCTKLL